jgi:small conductance mechanosensitive channel
MIEWFKTSGVRIIGIVVFGFILDRVLRFFLSKIGKGEGVEEKEKRMKTVTATLRTIGDVIIMVVCGIMIARELGVDIGPLLASLGIVGIAVGFGAQSLIRDTLNGFFIVFEDQFRVGDVINIGEKGGIVEKLGLRTTVVRSADGSVITIPNGEIRVISNLTKEWARAVVKIGIAYKEDLDRVFRLLDKIAEDVIHHPEIGEFILEKPDILGVDAIAESSIDIIIWIKTKPLKQWVVARTFRKILKQEFDKEGIEIPYTRV